jgi:3',5'-cyclic AMP phosphodiesterase CpdA
VASRGVLLQVSDPHFGTERPAVVRALLRLAQSQQPDLVVMSGDLTQRARRAQFDAAAAFVAALPAPVLAVPGNHDIPLWNLAARMVAPRANFHRAFGALPTVRHLPHWCVVGVDTTRAWLHTDGAVSPRQAEGVARELGRATASQLRIVVVHQPVAVVRAEDRRHLLRGREPALLRWSAAGADLVLGGHIHLPYVLTLDHLPRRLGVVQAGTAVSHRIRERTGNAVMLLRWPAGDDGAACRIEDWRYDEDEDRFACRTHTDFVPSRP